jgi:hypothetical protein
MAAVTFPGVPFNLRSVIFPTLQEVSRLHQILEKGIILPFKSHTYNSSPRQAARQATEHQVQALHTIQSTIVNLQCNHRTMVIMLHTLTIRACHRLDSLFPIKNLGTIRECRVFQARQSVALCRYSVPTLITPLQADAPIQVPEVIIRPTTQPTPGRKRGFGVKAINFMFR